jgi:Tol biopolymer transport system component
MASSGVISPDGTKVAFDRRDGQSSKVDIWLYDVARGTTTRFTFGPNGANARPVWSFDGSYIAFESNRDSGVNHVFQRAANGGTDEVLTPPLRNAQTRPEDWSRDGRYLVETAGGAQGDLWVQPLFGDKKPFPYLATPSIERQARLSPDGKWLAYSSDESTRSEIYVQSFPMPGSKAQISIDGGNKPVWSRDGKELYFISADRKMMAVSVKIGDKFEAGTPKALFDTRIGTGILNHFDVSKDGRFLIPTQTESVVDSPLTVIVNWPKLLKR